MNQPHQLPDNPDVPRDLLHRVRDVYHRFAERGLPTNLEEYLLDAYRLDVASTYAGLPIKNPWGKASGQLSMTLDQVREDVEAGLGFVVLKTVIAQDSAGGQSMAEWAIRESRMLPERIRGQSGDEGWTVTWKGRGWWQGLDPYLSLLREAVALAHSRGVVVAPSCKYHLPMPGEEAWRTDEYLYTTQKLLDAFQDAWQPAGAPQDAAMPLEKDFSPTLAGSSRAAERDKILDWLRAVPRLVRHAAAGRPVRLGLKLFNALFDDDFQLDMLRAVHAAGPDRPDFLVYANRLFDPDREFDGRRGIAYGGPDLSDRNLRVLDWFDAACRQGAVTLPKLELSATGNITTGKMAVEYLLRGCTSFQMHTVFQLPQTEYHMRVSNKTQKALHRLYFEPQTGFIVWALHTARQSGAAEHGAPIALAGLIAKR